jgi:alpha-tubulin suppressor-like RCC1 family protein
MKLGAARYHSLIIRGGTLSSSGANNVSTIAPSGALALGNNTTFSTHQEVSPSGWRHLAPSIYSTFVLKNDSTLWSCGNGAAGVLGLGDSASRNTLAQVGSAKWITISLGSGRVHSHGIQADSSLWGWGKNTSAQIGDGLAFNVYAPKKIGLAKWIQIGGGVNHSGGIQADSSLWTWGVGTNGQLGQGASATSLVPIHIGSAKWIMVKPGNGFTIAIRSDSTLWGWGANSVYQLGLDTNLATYNSPQQIGTGKWIDAGAGENYGAGLKSDSTLWTWGRSGAALGTGGVFSGTKTNRVPTQVGVSKWKSISVGYDFALGLDASNAYQSWGQNNYGMLGDGTTGNSTGKTAPVACSPVIGHQTIAFDPLSTKELLTADFAPGASTTSGLTISYTSSDPAVATIVGGRIHIVGLGTSTITASQAGDIDADAAVDAAQVLTVEKSNQTVSFTSVGNLTYGQNLSLTVSAPGTGATTFSVDNGTLASVTGNTLTALSGTGSVTVTATVDADANYNDGIATQIIALQKAAQPALAFDAIGAKAFGDAPFELFVTGGGGSGSVTYSVDNGSLASLSSNELTLLGPGTFILTATKAADANYASATAHDTVTVAKAPQYPIHFAFSMAFGDADLDPDGQSFSDAGYDHSIPGLTLTYASSDTSVAIIVGGKIHAVGVGSTTITGYQAGDSLYAADSMSRTFTIGKGSQSIAFASLPAKNWLDADFAPGATASSSLAISYASSNSAVATIVSNQIHLVGAGAATITASQAGNANYNAATNATQTLTVTNPPHPHQDRKVLGYGNGSIVIRDGIGLYGSGYNGYYDLGLGDDSPRNRFNLISLGNWRHLDGSSVYNLAIKDDSTLWGWGTHPVGFGDGSTVHTVPAQIGTSRWITVAVGLADAATHGIKADSTLWAWGDPGPFLYGDGVATQRTAPVRIGTEKWLDVSHTQAHVLAIKSDFTLWAWGAAAGGKLGNGATSGTVTTPIQIGSAKWRMMAAGYSASYGIQSDSTLWVWGANSSGQTGQGTAAGNTLSPTRIGNASTKWIWVDVGYQGVVALKSDSTLWSWGSNVLGKIAQGSASDVLTPTQVGPSKWRQVAMGEHHGIGRRDSGDYYAWGNNGAGALGDSSNTNSNIPVPVKFNRTQTFTFPALSAKSPSDPDFAPGASSNAGLAITYTSSDHAVATIVSGQVHLVGAGTATITASAAGSADFDAGEATRSLTVAKLPQTLTFASLPAKTWIDADFAPGAVASSGLTVAYSSSDNSVATIVSNQIHLVGVGTATITASQAGNGTYDAATDATRTLTVTGPPHPHKDRKVALMIDDALLIRDGIGIFGTGTNTVYQLGLGDDNASRNHFTLIKSGNWRHVDGGYEFALALKADSTLWAWGTQPDGFGDGSIEYRVPTQIGTGHWITAVAGVNSSAILGIQADSSLWAWGGNYYSILGDGTSTSQSTPTRIGADKWVDVAYTQQHVLGLKSDRTLWSWGTDEVNILGNGNFEQVVPIPTQVGSALWRMVSAGSYSSLAIKSDSTLWTWGGDIGTGLGISDGNTPVPTQVGTDKWIWVDGGGNNGNLGLKADSTLWSWGNNHYGAIALGSPNQVLVPTQVGSGKWRQAALGSGPGIGQTAAGDFYAWGANSTGTVGDSTDTDRRTPVPVKFNRTQVMSFPALAAKAFGDADFPPGASTNTGLALSYTSSNSAVATIVSGQVHIVGAGTTTITASAAGSAAFDAGEATQSLTVSKLPQTITFANPASRTWIEADFDPSATTTSSLAVAYVSSDTAVATIVSGLIHPVRAGTVTITASQAGNGTYAAATDVPRTLTLTNPPHPHHDRKVAGMLYSTLLIRDGIGLFGAGFNQAFELGLGNDSTSHNSFQLIQPGNWRHVDGGGEYAFALKGDSTLWGWGNQPEGFGDDSTLYRKPTQIGTRRWITVVAGINANSHYGIQSDSTLWAWGSNGQMNYGDGTNVSQSAPTQIGTDKWVDISFSQEHVLGIKADRTLWVWGSDEYGILGQGTLDIVLPVPVKIGSAKWSMVAAGASTSLAIRSDSTLWAWGLMGAGTGLGSGVVNILVPTQVDGGASKWLKVEVGGGFSTVALKADSTFWSFGGNGDGLIAQGAASGSGTPTQVGTGKWREVALGSFAGIGQTSAGDFYGWGKNTHGAVGDSTNTTRTTPVPVKFNRAQTFTFPAIADKSVGDADFAPGASSNTGIAITYASSDPAVATLVSGQIHIVGPGTTTITASAMGNAVFNAGEAARSLTVGRLAQSIAFDTLATMTYGDAAFAPGAVASSALTVGYASSDTTIAKIVGGQITVVGVGASTITASQAGNAIYDSAASVSRTLTVGKQSQIITFPAPSPKGFGDADFALIDSSSSGLGVTYVSSNTGVATVSGLSVHIVGAGSTTIIASQVGNGNYDSAASVQHTLTVGKQSQTIHFPALSAKAFGDADFILVDSTTSGLGVTYVSSNTAVATISGLSVHIVGTGTTIITASQAGNANFDSAASVPQALMVGMRSQTITFPSPAPKTFGDADFALIDSTSSGLAVSFMSSNAAVATVSGLTVHIVGAGTTTLTAAQMGNANYDSAASVSRTLTVGKKSQAIAFPAISTKAFGDADFALLDSTSSGLGVTYASSNTAVATVSGLTVHIVGAGSTLLTASQAGNSNYDSAASVSHTLTIGKQSQSITFPALSAKNFGDADLSLIDSSSSGLGVTYSSSNTVVATVTGLTVHIVGAGTATITASQAGNANFDSAASVPRTLMVGARTQVIAFPSPAPKTFGDADFTLLDSTSSGLAVTYASSNTAVATISGLTVHIVGAGSTILTASQAGSVNYDSAASVPRTLTVGRKSQAITFPELAAKTFGDADFLLGDSTSSGLGVAYASSNPSVATISGLSVHIVGAGAATITAAQAGNVNYDSAASISRALAVGVKNQTITFPALSAKVFGDADFILGDSTSSGLAVTYASSNTAVATVSSRTVHIVGAGTAALTASQTGNAFYAAAPDVVQVLTVGKANQTLAFAALPGKVPGDADFSPAAVASSGLSAAYSSSDTLVATIVGGLIHVVGAGNAVITASQSGNGDYNAAADTAQTLHVGKNAQSLVFGALPAKTFGDADFEAAATAGSGLPVTLASANPAVATIVSGQIHVVGAGSTVITASQAGNGTYHPAANVAQNLVVAKAAQSLTVLTLQPKTFGDSDFTLSATASSGLLPAFTLSDSLVATLVAGKVHPVGEGTAQVTWMQAGDSNHLAADTVVQALTVGRAAQSLTFDLGADTLKTLGEADFAIASVSSAGLAVSFSSSDSAVAAILGNTIRILKAGTATISAAQAGTPQYAPATPVSHLLRIRLPAPTAFLASELSPAAGNPVDTVVELSWPAKSGALAYRVQATLDTANPGSLVDQSISGTSFPLHSLPFGARIHWRLSASNATGSSAFSPYASLDVRPLPPAPVDITRIPTFPDAGVGKQVEIAWPKVEGSTGYHVQVSLDINRPPLIDTIVSTPTLSLSDLPSGSTQNWRVAPVNGVSEAPFIPWLTFKVRDKVEDAVTRSAVVDSAKPEAVQVSALVGVTSKDSSLSGVKITLTEEKKAPANLPPGFLPLTGRIELDARTGSGGGSIEVGDNQVSITLTAPDTLLDGTKVGAGEEPMVYLLDSATGELTVLYDLKKDSLGRIILPLSKGKSFMLAVDTVAPVVKDATSAEARESGSSPVISGTVDDNIRNSRAWLRYRQGGSETFDSVAVVIDASGHFEMPLSVQLDGTGFEYNLVASDGRNRKVTQSLDLPVSVKAMQAADSLPSKQWRLFALPTIANANDWSDMAASLGTYGQDWRLFERAPEGLREFGPGLKSAKPGAAYWLKSRTNGFQPSISGGIAASISKPFVIALPPKSWRSFGNPFLFPVAWQTVLDSSHKAADALVGPYTFRDSSWISPLEIPALEPWEGYYAYNPTNDTVYMRIPSIRAKAAPAPLAKAAFHLQWQVRGADGKDAGNFFGALPLPEKPAAKVASPGGAAVKSYGTATVTSFWNLPKPQAPDAGLRAGFAAPDASGGLLQTDFRDVPAQSGSTWTARLDGLRQGQRYSSRFLGLSALPEGLTVGLADPATGYFAIWNPDMAYVVEAKEGETERELQVYAGTAEYVQALGSAFEAAHPSRIELGNYPNPIRDYTVVRFAVPVSASTSAPRVKMTVYDMQGRRIKVLLASPMATGRHSLRWDARDDQGRRVAAGNYRLLLEVGSKRMNRALQIAY